MDLNDLTLNELWDLFPIIFVDPTDKFKKIYHEETQNLESLLTDHIRRISHIGSTSIKNIKTKPIVDILIEIDPEDMDLVKEILLNNGYILMNEYPEKSSFNKGYTESGYAEKVFHIHIKNCGDHDELYFRDYLNDNVDAAKEYEKLKTELYDKYKPNRDLYTAGKSEFVKKRSQWQS